MQTQKEVHIADLKVLLLCLTLLIGVFLLDIAIPLGVAGGVPYILVVLVSLWSSWKNLPIYMAICGSVLTLAGFYSSPEGGELWKVLSNRALAVFAIWTTAVLSVQRGRILVAREIALAELKTLKGFIPICTECKKIRNAEGSWSQIESYIQDHSEAEFSHGICPDCAKRLYPDFVSNRDIGEDE